jgi:hypothetical protein
MRIFLITGMLIILGTNLASSHRPQEPNVEKTAYIQNQKFFDYINDIISDQDYTEVAGIMNDVGKNFCKKEALLIDFINFLSKK